MTQKQLDIKAATKSVNSVRLDFNHEVEIRDKGQVVGIYTLSGPERKKRGVALPLESFITLQEQLALINFKIQLASGTLGLNIVQPYDYAHQPSTQPTHGTTLYNGFSYEQELCRSDFKLETLPQWHQPSCESTTTRREYLQPEEVKYELCQQTTPVEYYYG